MKHIHTLVLGVAALAGACLPLSSAHAWVAAGARGVAVGGFHGGYGYGYHPAYRPAGCYGCGAAVGAVAGMAVGAAVASSYYQPPVVVAQPAVVMAPPPVVVQGGMPLGTQIAALPGGSRSMVVNGTNYYQYGATWYKPYYGSSGVYYEVVPTP